MKVGLVMTLDKLYPHQTETVAQIAEWFSPWVDDPCDEIDFNYICYLWLQTTKDMQLRSRLKILLNMRFGKFNDNINHRYGKMGVRFDA